MKMPNRVTEMRVRVFARFIQYLTRFANVYLKRAMAAVPAFLLTITARAMQECFRKAAKRHFRKIT
jgi:hypothetical protein